MSGSIDQAGDKAQRNAMKKAKKAGGSLYLGSDYPGRSKEEALCRYEKRKAKEDRLLDKLCGK